MALTIQAIVETWLYNTLSSDATLGALVGTRIFANEVPESEDSAYPCVVFGFLGGDDLMIQSAVRVWTETLYKVEVIGKDVSFSSIDSIYSIVDSLIHRGAGVIAGGQVYSCVRQQIIQLTETAEGGIKYRRSGGLYTITASPT